MTLQQIHSFFRLELDKTNGYSTPSFEHAEIDYWVNAAINLYVSTRYTGNNPANESFEQTQKRIDDLAGLIKTQKYTYGNTGNSNYWEVYPIIPFKEYAILKLPDNYRFAIGESVTLYANILNENSMCFKHKGDQIGVDATTSKLRESIDTFSLISKKIHNYKQELLNSLSDSKLSYGEAQPICVWRGGLNNPRPDTGIFATKDPIISFYTDGNYGVYTYTLDYIRKPTVLNYDSTDSVKRVDESFVSEFKDYSWHEIIKIAVKLALGNISDMQRAQSVAADVATME